MKIDIVFGYFTVVMEFDSQTKLKQWLDAFATIRSMHTGTCTTCVAT